MSENGEIYTAGKNFTLPPAVTGWTNSTSGTSVIAGLRLAPPFPYTFTAKVFLLRKC